MTDLHRERNRVAEYLLGTQQSLSVMKKIELTGDTNVVKIRVNLLVATRWGWGSESFPVFTKLRCVQGGRMPSYYQSESCEVNLIQYSKSMVNLSCERSVTGFLLHDVRIIFHSNTTGQSLMSQTKILQCILSEPTQIPSLSQPLQVWVG